MDELEQIVRALGSEPPPQEEMGNCALCRASHTVHVYDPVTQTFSYPFDRHDPDCAWRRARAWVEEHPEIDLNALDTQHPFKPFPGTDATNFIQWKGTNVCMDFYCPCGEHNHYDDDFAYYVACKSCGAVYQLGTQVKAKRVEQDDQHWEDAVWDNDASVVLDTNRRVTDGMAERLAAYDKVFHPEDGA